MAVNVEAIEPKKPQEIKGTGGYYALITISILLLYVFNNLLANVTNPIQVNLTSGYPGIIESLVRFLAEFRLGFLTIEFLACLWAVNLALSFGIVGNFLLLVYRPRWFHHLVQAVLYALGILALAVILRIFPFDFDTDIMATAARIIIFILMVCLGAGLIYSIYASARAFINREPPAPSVPVLGPYPETPFIENQTGQTTTDSSDPPAASGQTTGENNLHENSAPPST